MFEKCGSTSWTCGICGKRMTINRYDWLICEWILCELYHFFHCLFVHKLYPYNGIKPLIRRLDALLMAIITQPIYFIIKLFLFPFVWLSEKI